MTSILVKLFEHNRWANLRAVEVCAVLPDTHLDVTVAGTAGSVRDTLMHIAGAEQRYVMRLSGRQPTYGERDGWPGTDRLGQALGESGQTIRPGPRRRPLRHNLRRHAPRELQGPPAPPRQGPRTGRARTRDAPQSGDLANTSGAPAGQERFEGPSPSKN